MNGTEYKAEPQLFLSANNKVLSAKTLINECKNMIDDQLVTNNSNYDSAKASIENCNIENLVNKIETEKKWQLENDQEFAKSYMSLLAQNLQIDQNTFNKLSEEEKLEYSIKYDAYNREFNDMCILILEKNEQNGMLTDDLKAELEMRKKTSEQYDLKDKMSLLDPTSDEYIKMYEKYADLDISLIKMNSNLTEEQKTKYINEYKNNFESRISILKDQNELNQLIVDKEKNSDFWHPIVENTLNERILELKVKLNQATPDEEAYYNMNGWDKLCANTKTFSVSAYTGLFDVAETIGDGVVMLGAEARICNKDWASEYVAFDQSADLYDYIVDSSGMNKVSSYSSWHTIGTMTGSTIGYIGLSLIPGGAAVTAAAGGLAAMGSSSERALQNGASFDEAFSVGAVAMAAGAASGWMLGGINSAVATNTTSLLNVGANVLKGVGVSVIEPILNTSTEYIAYAKDIVDENDKKVYNNFWDYYVDGGGLTNTVMAAVIGGSSTGVSSVKGLAYNKVVKNYENALYDYTLEKGKWEVLSKKVKQYAQTLNGTSDNLNVEEYIKKFNVKLSDAEIKEVKLSAKLFAEERTKFNVKKIQDTCKKYKANHSGGVELLTNGENPGDYFGAKFVDDWKSQFNFDKNGNSEVVVFKSGKNYDNFVKGKKVIGRDDGEFIMSKETANKVINKCTVNGEINVDKLCEELQLPKGSFDSGVISVTQTINEANLALPTSKLGGSMFGEWIPTGETGGGVTEGVVSQVKLSDNGTWVDSLGSARKVSINDYR